MLTDSKIGDQERHWIFPSRIPSMMVTILNVTFPDSVAWPPFIRLISLMQAIWKSQSSPMSPKSAARRFWFIWTLRTLSRAIVNGPIAVISLNLNWRRMPEYTWCRRVHLWKVSLWFIWLIFFYAYSNAQLPIVGHTSTGTVTPWLSEGRAWIRPHTLIDAHQSASFTRQKVRLLEEPWPQWPMNR